MRIITILLLLIAIGTSPFVSAHVDSDRVVAVIGNDKIMLSEVDNDITKELYDIELQKYKARYERMKTLLINMRIEKELDETNITIDEYIADKVKVDRNEISETLLDEYLTNNGYDLDVPKDRLVALRSLAFTQVESELEEQKLRSLLKNILEKYPSNITMKYPLPPLSLRHEVKGSGNLRKGAPNGTIKFILFSGFDCAYCANDG